MPKTKISNTELMKQMGSDNGAWDPEPPDQWRYQMLHGETPQARLIGWVKAHTVAMGHQTPYATDEHGQPLTIKHVIADLDWNRKHAEHTLREAVKAGLIQWDAGPKRTGQIILSALVPSVHLTDFKQSRSEDGVCTDSKSPLLRLAPYIREQIEHLPADTRKRFEQWYAKEYTPWKLKAEADAMDAVRRRTEQVQFSALAALQVKVKQGKKRRPAAETVVAVEIQTTPEFVQTPDTGVPTDANSGLCSAEKPAVQKRETPPTPRQPPEQSAPQTQTSDREIKKPAAAATSEDTQQEQQQVNLSDFPETDAAITRHFPSTGLNVRQQVIRKCLSLPVPALISERQAWAQITDSVIARAVEAATTKDQRSGALYLETVPRAVENWIRAASRRTA
jgi:hypothetical protein